MATILVESTGSTPILPKKGTTVVEPNANTNHHPSVEQGGRALAGFLYSFSKKPQGEFFPLYEGKNSIGSSVNAHIYLAEESVSEKHAAIFIIKRQNQKCLDFRIKDEGSTNSTFVNEHQLFAGDVLLIEERSKIIVGAYELKVLKIDHLAEELGVNPAFKAIQTVKADAFFNFGDLGKIK
jgi:FHA domain